MLIHDTRLLGTAPAIAANVYKVDGAVSIIHIFSWAAQYARSKGGLSTLSFMCHGIMGGVYDTAAGTCDSALGFGLLVGKENLTSKTLYAASALNGLVRCITIYACGPANTRSGFATTVADGNRLCRELAAITNAEVIAAVETQWYYRRPPMHFVRRLFGIGRQDIIDFGAWEGAVYRFSPDGSSQRLIQ